MHGTLVSQSLLHAVVALAQTASRAIVQIYATPFAVEAKADASPLTAADRTSHDIIVAGLRSLTPAVPVLSEESDEAVHDHRHRGEWSRLWLVDPLDGTREFVNRNGDFTVNIALIEAHRPVLGVLAVPAFDRVYFGARGLGAWCQAAQSEPERLHPTVPARPRPIVLGSRSHPDERVDAVLERLGPHELLRVGSALKFCRLAEGTADFYPRFGVTSEWDTAAGQAVLESAGGQVIDLHGEPLRYNARASLSNPAFMAFADGARDWRAYATGE